MKILKHSIASLLTLSLFAVSGCAKTANEQNSINNNSTVSSSQHTDEIDKIDDNIDDASLPETIIPIYDVNNQEIGSFSCYFYSVCADKKILYTKFLNVSDDDTLTETLEYWLYDLETKQSYKLGTVEKWANDAAYEAVEVNGHLYYSISTGEFASKEDSKLTIYDIDLTEHTMSPMLEIEGGIYSDSYTVAGDKLILAELLYNGDTDIIEYDLSDKRSEPVVHTYNESECFVHDSIRHICADEQNIYMVRLDWDENDKYFLYLDKYDLELNLLNTIDIRDFCVSTDFERAEEDKINEWKQFIAYFIVRDNLIFYKNFSTTAAIGTINNDKIDRLFESDELLSYAYPVQNDTKNELFIRSYGDDTENRNLFYLVDTKTNEVNIASFYTENHDYAFRSAYRMGDTILLTMGYVPYSVGERLPERLYYIDINDLDFKPLS